MATLELHVHKIELDQNFGTDDDFMKGKLFFDLELDGELSRGFTCDIKQTVGSEIDVTPIEVYPPAGYDGPMNYRGLSRLVDQAFRFITLVGIGSRLAGKSGYEARDLTLAIPFKIKLEVPDF